MNFIKQLIPTEDTLTLANIMPFNEDLSFRMFNGIKIDDELWISIQASYGHYCLPRKTLQDINDYTAMEFALMDGKGGFLTVTDVLPSFSRIKEIEEHCDTVYSYVPVDLIDDLFKELTA